jgi:hypothetical protein
MGNNTSIEPKPNLLACNLNDEDVYGPSMPRDESLPLFAQALPLPILNFDVYGVLGKLKYKKVISWCLSLAAPLVGGGGSCMIWLFQ